MRERIATIVMALSLLAAVGFGGAVATQVGKPRFIGTVGQGAPAATSTTASSAGTQGTAATQGHTVVTSGQSTTTNLSTAGEGVKNGLITVGGIFDETGPVDSTVERDVIRAYFNKVNAAGGVNGYQLRLLDCDSAYDATQAHQCSERLLAQGVLAFVGNNSVSGEQQETVYLTKHGVPIVGGLGVDSEFHSPLSYPVVASFVRDGAATGGHTAEQGLNNVAVVLVNLNFVQPAEAALRKSLEAHHIHVTSYNHVDITKPDYSDLVFKLQQENPQGVLAGLDPFSYARFFQAMERANWYPKFGGLGLDKPSAQKEYGRAVYGAESITSVIEPQDHQDLPAIRDYFDTVRRYFPNQMDALDYFSEGDWVAAKVFVEAVRRIGSNPVNRQTLVNALNSIKNFDTGLTVPISYSPGSEHDPNHCYQYIRNEQGTWHTYSGWKCF